MNYGGCGLDENWNKLSPNDIVGDPLFLDTAKDDYRLKPGSPAINAGDPSISDTNGSRSDMGAYGGAYPIDG